MAPDRTAEAGAGGGVAADHVVVMTTLAGKTEAEHLCRSLVEDGLAACAQRFPVDSVYRWQGQLVEDHEILVLLKTRRARARELVEALEARHPYDVPEIIELPVTGGSLSYLRWMDAQTSPPG